MARLRAKICPCSILAAYDFGATAQQLELIYQSEKKDLDDIHLADRSTKKVEEQHVEINAKNWTQYVGQDKYVCSYAARVLLLRSSNDDDHRYYACFVKFFSGVVAELGPAEALEQYIFSPAANGNGASMQARFINGA